MLLHSFSTDLACVCLLSEVCRCMPKAPVVHLDMALIVTGKAAHDHTVHAKSWQAMHADAMGVLEISIDFHYAHD